MAPPRRISAIIPSFNRPDYLRRVLVSLAAQTQLVDEVVISDDGSRVDVPKAIADVLPALPFPVHFVRQPDEGFRAAKCRNNGIRAATGEYLIFGDQDIVLDRSYVETFARQARPGEFLVGCPARLNEEQTARVTEEMVRAGTAAQLASPRERRLVRKQYLKDRWYRVLHALRLRPIGPKLRSGVFGAWRADLLAVNGFDEEYRGWGGEDDNLGARLHRAGIRGRNVFPRVVTVHLHHPPHHIEGGRSSADHHARAWRAIRAGQVRARHGIENPLGGDVSERRTLHEPGKMERRASSGDRAAVGVARPFAERPVNLASGRFLIPTRLEGSPFFARFHSVFETVATRLGAELRYCDDIDASDLPPDCPFVVPFRPVMWGYSEGFKGLLTLPASIRVLGFWDDVHQGMKGTHWFHRDRRVLLRHFRRADAIITSNRTPFLKWYPRFADKLEHVPMFFTAHHFADVEFNEDPLRSCILTGSTGKFYPFRQTIASTPGVTVIQHPGYGEVMAGGTGGVFGVDYARELSRYVCGATCGSILGYVVAKYFEIPAAGCLLLAPYLPDLDLLGFRDGVNYVAVTERDFGAKLKDVLARPEAYEAIRRAGFELVRLRHADTHRADQLERFIRDFCRAGAS